SVAQNRGVLRGSAQQNGGVVREAGGLATADGTRPVRLVVVAGTGTEVGKTWVAAALIRTLLDQGLSVAARKPAQSFEPGDLVPDADGHIVGTDADHLAEATGEDPLIVCPPHRRYEVPMAPPMAADVLGRDRIEIDDLALEVAASWGANGAAEPFDLGLVELAGGTRSPAAHDGDGVKLARALAPDVIVLVADAGLGTIHSVRAALDGLAGLTARTVVHLNRYEGTELQRRNRDQLIDDGCVVTTSIDALADTITPGAGAVTATR
ncbi:MAG TPA: dethiobiotin synthase, partial [Microthrixaceae bacterium]|nr:dethiobiotin synthase [Microthrixaceae bacterium]